VKLSVLIPVYNEENTLKEAIRRVQRVNVPKEIIVIDDGSKDRSRDILASLDADAKKKTDPMNELKVIFKSVNEGKGAAIRSGLAEVTGDVVIVQDADLEYNPQDYPKLLDPIEAGEADVVYGTRFYGGGPHRVLFFLALCGQPNFNPLC